MVIGNGLVATQFRSYADNNDFLIFASGVSNSKSTDQAEYEREFDLLRKSIAQNKDKTVVYFSTCSINDPEESRSAYVTHKKNIEQFINSNASRYLIVRGSNLVGRSDNPNTVLNFFVNNIKQNNHFSLWVNATRNIIDVADFFLIIDHILKSGLFINEIVNVANPRSYLVTDVVCEIENCLNRKADYTPVAKGSAFNIDVSAIVDVLQELKINFGDDYLQKLLSKYYS